MRKINYLILLCLSIIQLNLQAQCSPFDALDAGWTPAGTLVAGNLTTPLISSGDYNIIADNLRGEQDYRLYRTAPCTFNANDKWRVEFDFTPNLPSSSYNMFSYFPFALTESTAHFYGNLGPTNSTAIMLGVSTTTNTTTNLAIWPRARYNGTYGPAGDKIYLNFGSKYYIRYERLKTDKMYLSVFSDPLYTSHVTGSPVCYGINPQISNLKHIQTANTTSFGCTNRAAKADIDEMNLFDNVIDEFACDEPPAVCDVNANMAINVGPCQVEFINTSTIGPGNFFMGSVINFDDGRFEEIGGSGSSLMHSYWTPGIYRPCITTFTYIYDGQDYICCSDEYCLGETGINPQQCFEPDNSLQIQPTPPCEIVAQPSISVGCNGAISVKNLSYFTYGTHLTSLIDFGDGIDPNNPNEIDLGDTRYHQYNANGSYVVCITVFGYSTTANGKFECCSTKVCQTVKITNVGKPCIPPNIPFRLKASDDTFDETIFMSPNPVIDNLNMTLKKGINRVRVLSVSGKLIQDFLFTETTETIDMSQYQKGIYIVTVENNGEIEYRKIIKQ